MYSSCNVFLQYILCDNRSGSEQCKEGDRRILNGGREDIDGTLVWHLHVHMGAYTCLYARVCMPMCVPGLNGYQGNGCVGLIRESPAGGEGSEAVPWQPTGQGGVCICAALALDWIVVLVDEVCVCV